MEISTETRIVCTPGTCGGRPRVSGTRIRVQDIYVWYELAGESVDEIVSNYPQLTPADVHTAMAYFWQHREEIQRQMRADEEFVDALRARRGPGPLERKLKVQDVGQDPVSS